MGPSALVASVVLLLGQAAAPPAPPKPLPGNKACPFPTSARDQGIAGPVRFTARVTPDGSVESVEVRRTPWPGVGFEETVRGCVLQWRFEPEPAAPSPRTYEGQMRFRLTPADEDAIRAVLGALAEAWNAEDKKAIAALEVRAGQLPQAQARWLDERPFLRKAVQGDAASDDFRIELEPEIVHLRFETHDLVRVRQVVYRTGRKKGQGAGGDSATLDLALVRGSEGWRFILPVGAASRAPARVGLHVQEPKKLKDVRPEYPSVARQARVQGVVILDCLISTEGKVTEIKVLRGVPLLDQAAVEAVRQWLYEPTLVKGEAVPVFMEVTLRFNLRE